MSRSLIIALIGAVLIFSFSCANPAANKPKAQVENAAPEATPPKPASAETLVISPENSKVEFVAAKVTRSHNGSFKQFTGTIDLVNNSAENSRVTIDIQTNSVVTDEDGLTKHLQTPDFFDVAKFPKATFASTKIEANTTGGATHNVTGNFELHGIKKSIMFPATIRIAADSVSINAEFSINRKDWGLAYPGKMDDMIRDGVVIKLTLQVPRKP
jgi:polyisoprenoid-binding protein YceI